MPNKRLSIFFFLLPLTVVTVFSQDNVTPGAVRYFNSFSISMLTNEHDVLTGGFTTTHGVAFSRFKAGAGMGVMGYRNWRTYPLFLSGTMNLHRLKKDFGLYVQFNAGHAFGDWLLKSEWTTDVEVRGGAMINPMVGYRFAFGKPAVYVAAGYMNQRLRYEYSIWGTDYFVKEYLNRVVFQIGIGLD